MKLKMNGVLRALSKRSPQILMGMAIAGFGTAIGWAVLHDTPKYKEAVEEKKKDVAEGETLSKKDVAVTAAKSYAGTALIFGLSTACAIGGMKEQEKRNAALAAAYTIAETTLMNYRNGVVEAVGEKKEKEIAETVAVNNMKKNLQEEPDPVPVDRYFGRKTQWVYEPLSRRWFMSDYETLRSKINDFNELMIGELYLTLNDWLDMIGAEPLGHEVGDTLGWSIETGKLDIVLAPAPVLKDGTIAGLGIDYRCRPPRSILPD